MNPDLIKTKVEPKIEGPYKKKSTFLEYIDIIAKAFVVAIIAIIVIWGINRIMIINKTLNDAMDQLMEIRLEIDEYKETTSKEINELIDHVKRNTYPLTLEERQLIESIIMSEARGEPYEGQLAVAQVIRDRSELWDKTIKEVCLASGQFAEPYNGESHILAKHAVWEVFYYGTRIIEEPVTFFHADWINDPYWTKSKVNRGSVGSHKFWGN